MAAQVSPGGALSRCEHFAGCVLGWSNRKRWRIFAVAAPVVLLVHLLAASHLIDHANQDPARSDQGAEIWLARVTWHNAHPWPMQTDAVRNPLWSWLASRVFEPEEEAFFHSGKWLNTGLACGFLVLLGAMATTLFGGVPGATVMALSSLGILLTRGVFFQPEPLYYAFSFLAAFACWMILGRNAWWWYLVLGLTGGIAALAKPSFEPMAAIFIAALCLRCLLERRLPWRDVAGLLLASGIILAMMTPLLLQKRELFGSATFSYPKVWMWMDDFDTEAWPWQTEHPGKLQLEALDPKEIPSVGWYFKRHGMGTALTRLAGGSSEVFARFLFPETRRSASDFFWKSSSVRKWEQPLTARGVYLLVLCALPLILATRLGAPPDFLITPSAIARTIFVVGVFLIYLLLYGWYFPIGRGDRFMGSLWIPCVFFFCFLGSRALSISAFPFKNSVFLVAHVLILASLTLQAVNLLVLFSEGVTPTLRN